MELVQAFLVMLGICILVAALITTLEAFQNSRRRNARQGHSVERRDEG